ESPSGKAASAAIPNKLAKDVETIYDTLDKVETKSLKDRINFGAELRTRVDDFKLKNDPMPGGLVNDHNDNYWTNRFRLNMDAEIQKNLLFNGRLTVYKGFANDQANQNASDASAAHLPGDTSVKLDRAYVDWTPEGMPIPLALTFGRHPSSEGPPNELKENRLRQSTYPSLLFDGEADGVVATVGLERYLGWKNSAIRFAWGKGYQDSNPAISYLDNGSHPYDDINVYATFFETEIPGVRDSLLVLSALEATGINGMGNIQAPNATVGNMSLYGIHAQANNVADTGFDIFLSSGLNKTDPNGNAPNGIGLLDSDGTTKHSGWAVYTGLRYNIPYKPMNNPKIGFEYNYGSQYWASFTWGPSELYNKLATRGNVYDFYYIQPFNDNLFGRLGYTHINYNYGMMSPVFGEPGSSNATLDDVYFLLDVRF
ncbi:MAG: DUF3373 family protein, partial [Desulfurivibrionaceae bacterium]